MEMCLGLTQFLYQYAKDDFPKQISFDPTKIGVSPLGATFSQWKSIKDLGLKVPDSKVDHQIAKLRDGLKENYILYQQYAGWIKPLIDGSSYHRFYPSVKLNQDLVSGL